MGRPYRLLSPAAVFIFLLRQNNSRQPPLEVILVLFADTENISKKYKLTAKAGEDLSAYSTSDMDLMMAALDNKTKGLAIQRQKKGRFLKLTSWALYHRSALKGLLEQTVLLLDEIERLVPAPQARTTLVQQEAGAIGDKKALKLVEDATMGVDSLLQNTVKEVIAGHQYSNIGIKGRPILETHLVVAGLGVRLGHLTHMIASR